MTDFSTLITARSQITIRTAIYAELAADEVEIEGLSPTHLPRA